MKSSWTISRDPDKGIVTVTTTGVISAAVSDRIMTDLVAMKLDPQKVRLLVDHRAADTKFTTLDIFELPQSYQVQKAANRFWVATVFKELTENQEFYRKMCREHGFDRIEIFADYDAALRWLTSLERK